jgi:hypothetical protein
MSAFGQKQSFKADTQAQPRSGLDLDELSGTARLVPPEEDRPILFYCRLK